MLSDIVWEANLDKGAWKVVVTRSKSDPDRGELRIRRGASGEVCHTALVPLAYGAPFGPDVDDVLAWQEYVINWVDSEGAGA